MSTSASSIPQITVIKVRVVAHTMGPVVPGGQLSQNHWSIYLLSPDGGSVRLNMEWVRDTGDKGKFIVTRHAYAQTTSAVRVFDYDVASGAKVQSFLRVLGEKKRQNYKLTSSGVGCRFWVYVCRLVRRLNLMQYQVDCLQ
jgi:hypothetical protein